MSEDMARSKAVVTRKEASSESLGGVRGHGGRRPPTASARKDKQKIHMQATGPASSDVHGRVFCRMSLPMLLSIRKGI
ncbi:hypothetical protein Syun_001441 [Stephania yunnanensis]|uniref:Uncharacterized protein n=1 Tax=Stephania yunnanensis TaxID=152371 RepID=A0AAP0QAW8_9MAGN